MLAEDAQRIGGVVNLIKSVAGWTRLLALNAMIEAARAGNAGRDFVVVASEMKQLASQTATATEDARPITQIQQAGASMQGIVATIKKVSETATSIPCAVKRKALFANPMRDDKIPGSNRLFIGLDDGQ